MVHWREWAERFEAIPNLFAGCGIPSVLSDSGFLVFCRVPFVANGFGFPISAIGLPVFWPIARVLFAEPKCHNDGNCQQSKIDKPSFRSLGPSFRTVSCAMNCISFV